MSKPKPRVRWTLLFLLWAWAACIALVLDLFLNVEAFDRVRPRARTYGAMRYVAHQMVGEPYRERDLFTQVRRRTVQSVRPVKTASLSLAPSPRFRTPDSPQGTRLLQGLQRVAQTSQEPERRLAAVRGIARIFADHDALRAVAEHPGQDEAVAAAARLYLEKGSVR